MTYDQIEEIYNQKKAQEQIDLFLNLTNKCITEPNTFTDTVKKMSKKVLEDYHRYLVSVLHTGVKNYIVVSAIKEVFQIALKK